MGTKKKTLHITTPRSSSNVTMCGRSAMVRRVTVVLTCTGMSKRAAARMARRVMSNDPGTRRKSSCSSARDASRLTAMRDRPWLFIFATASSVSSGVALGVSDGSSPRSLAYAIRSKVSSRLSGSPPVMTKTFGCIVAISSISRKPSAVVSSNWLRRDCAAARQCTQERSHARVFSQMTTNGLTLKSVIAAPSIAPTPDRQPERSPTA